MKSFVLKVLLFLALQTTSLAVILSQTRDATDNHFFMTIVDKEAAFHTSRPPRAVIIGGSNGPFGLECGEIEKETPYHPVNLALHAGLGHDFWFRQLHHLYDQSSSASGDVVIISMEHQLFQFQRGPLPPTLIDQVRVYPPALEYMSLKNRRIMLDNLLLYIGSRIRVAESNWRHPELLKLQGVVAPYNRNGFDRFGDVRPELRNDHRKESVGVFTLNVSRASIRRTLEDINIFARSMRERGVTVTLFFPPIPETVYRREEKHLLFLEQVLQEEADFPILNRMSDAAYPDEDFFDTVYHLNPRGSMRRTRETIAALNKLAEESGLAAK